MDRRETIRSDSTANSWNDIRSQSLSEDELLYSRESSRSDDELPTSLLSGRRTKSLCTFQLNEYSIGEIRRLHERLTPRDPVKDSRKASFRDFSRSQVLALCCLCFVNFISFCSMSILAPFFPKEASEKGMSGSTAGLVFSFYAFIIFIFSPVAGKIIPTIGAKFVFTSGLFFAGGCNLFFGALEYILEPKIFLVYCFLIRGMEALGAAAYSTATYVFVVEIFPTNVGSVLGLMETFVGLGMSLGPAIGGLLYSVGGFGLPFFSLGIIHLLAVPLSLCLMPTLVEKPIGRKNKITMLHLLRNPAVCLFGAVIVVISISWSFLDPTLEPHLRTFNLTPGMIGLIFLLFSGVYAVTSPILGWLSDRCRSPYILMSLGLFMSGASLLLLGPAPFLSDVVPASPWMNIVALTILGASVSLGLLPTFQGILDSAANDGFGDDSSTYSLVAVTWSSLCALGDVVGPLAGGVITDSYNFEICCTIVGFLCTVLGVCCMLAFLMSKPKVNSGSSRTSDSGYSHNSDDELDEEKPLLSRKTWKSDGE